MVECTNVWFGGSGAGQATTCLLLYWLAFIKFYKKTTTQNTGNIKMTLGNVEGKGISANAC